MYEFSWMNILNPRRTNSYHLRILLKTLDDKTTNKTLNSTSMNAYTIEDASNNYSKSTPSISNKLTFNDWQIHVHSCARLTARNPVKHHNSSWTWFGEVDASQFTLSAVSGVDVNIPSNDQPSANIESRTGQTATIPTIELPVACFARG